MCGQCPGPCGRPRSACPAEGLPGRGDPVLSAGAREGLAWGTQARGRAAVARVSQAGACGKQGEAERGFRAPHTSGQGQGDTVRDEGGEASGQGPAHATGGGAAPMGVHVAGFGVPTLHQAWAGAGPALSLVKLGDSGADGHPHRAGWSTGGGPRAAQARPPERGPSLCPPSLCLPPSLSLCHCPCLSPSLCPCLSSLEKRDFRGSAAERAGSGPAPRRGAGPTPRQGRHPASRTRQGRSSPGTVAEPVPKARPAWPGGRA